MNVGMLWFDNDPHTSLISKVQQAVEYYRRKYGREPNLCLVHPTMLQEEQRLLSQSGKQGIVIRPYRAVLPSHFWIGIEEEEQAQRFGKSRALTPIFD